MGEDDDDCDAYDTRMSEAWFKVLMERPKSDEDIYEEGRNFYDKYFDENGPRDVPARQLMETPLLKTGQYPPTPLLKTLDQAVSEMSGSKRKMEVLDKLNDAVSG